MEHLVLNIQNRVDALASEVSLLEIKSDLQNDDAVKAQSRSLNIEKEIIRRFEEIEIDLGLVEPKQKLKELAELKKKLISGLKNASDIITSKRAIYEQERDELERQRLEEVHKEQQRRMKIEAFKMEESGVPKDVIKTIQAENEPVLDLENIPELRSKTNIKFKYLVTIRETDLGQKCPWLNSAKKIQKAEPNLLLPTTPAMKKALEAKIKKMANDPSWEPREIPGVLIRSVPTTTRRDLK